MKRRRAMACKDRPRTSAVEPKVAIFIQTSLPAFLPLEDVQSFITKRITPRFFGRELPLTSTEINDIGYGFTVLVSASEASRLYSKGTPKIEIDPREVRALLLSKRYPAYYIEEQVINMYNNGKLSAAILDELVAPYKGDAKISEKSCKLKSDDGLNYKQIICKTMKPNEYADVMENPRYVCCFPNELEGKDENQLWLYNIRADWLFDSIWRGMWGFGKFGI